MSALSDMIRTAQSTNSDKAIVYEHLSRNLAAYRNKALAFASVDTAAGPSFPDELHTWTNDLLKSAWAACEEPGGECSSLDPDFDTSTKDLLPLPPQDEVDKLLTAILFLHITKSGVYSARTRAFLSSLGDLNEGAIVSTLKNPDKIVEEAQRVREEEARRGATRRKVGMGVGAIVGGVVVGVTGGLAAPLIGASFTTVLGWLGVGGSVAGLYATGLASSSVVCGALFGAYGAGITASVIEHYTREVKDLAIIPVHVQHDTLAVRLCVSGWLNTDEDVTVPWTIFDQSQDTFALRWETEALRELSHALVRLLEHEAMKVIKEQIVKRTFLASLMSSLAPLALLQLGTIIDNPWTHARSLAVKTGRVLGILLASRVFGARPVTLTGYSLGSLVIFEALKYLSTLPPSETMHLIDDVFLFGLPAPSGDLKAWCAIRRLVCGRLVNGHVGANEDYVLAVLSRASAAFSGWGVAGLEPVAVEGVENIKCEGIVGHLQWVGKVGMALKTSGARGISQDQLKDKLKPVDDEKQKQNPVEDEDVDLLLNEVL